MTEQNKHSDAGGQQNSSAGDATQKEKEVANEQKGGQGSKGGPDQHGAHGMQSHNPNGKLPSGQDGNQGSSTGSGGGHQDNNG